MYFGTGSETKWNVEESGRPSDTLLDVLGLEPPGLFGEPPPQVGGIHDFSGGLGGYQGWDGSHQPMRLEGDWYHEPETVKRGVCMVNPGATSQAFGDDFASADGHWWAEDGWSTKGEGAPFADGHHFMDKMAFPAPSCMDKLFTSPLEGGQASAAPPHFPEDVEPAEVALGGAACTSVTLDRRSAAEVAAAVHEFLTTEVTSSIQKVRPHKFVIKADVFLNVGGCRQHCLLKVRVFQSQHQPGTSRQLVVEFSRRSGDGVAFQHMYEKAAQYLQDRCSVAVGQAVMNLNQPPSAVPPDDAMTGHVVETDLGILLDMASGNASPGMQAEAVAALTVLASASAAGASMVLSMWGQLQQVLVNLVANSEIHVAYPAACLALQLIRHCSVQMVNQFVVAVLERVVTKDSDCLVRSELAEVVRTGVSRLVEEDTSKSWCELQPAIEKALLLAPSDQADFTGRLREALEELKVQRFRSQATPRR